MRFSWLALAAALGIGTVSTLSAQAASNADYLALRNKTSLASLESSKRISDQFMHRGGEVIEVEGIVSGVFSGASGSGYLLRINADEMLFLSDPSNDPEITIGKSMRVLARIPERGTTLESVSATTNGPELARADLANLRVDDKQVAYAPITEMEIIPDNYPPVVVYRAPNLSPQPATRQRPQVVDENLPLSRQRQVVQAYAARIREINDSISSDLAMNIAYHLLNKSEQYGVDPRLVFALVCQESRFNPLAVSRVGAQGLGQLMPGTAAGLGVRNAFDVEENLDGTVRYISQQLGQFKRLSLALAAYNAGPGNVSRYGGVPPFRETQHYVRTIWTHYAKLAGVDAKTGQPIAMR